jgi:DNA-binding GntR family transcriptional regulator
MYMQTVQSLPTSETNENTKSASLTEQLIEAIVAGTMRPGSKISEPELAKLYQVSRGPLREAIMRLEGLGLIERRPHVGATIVEFNINRLIELYDVRESLEGMAARLAATHITADQLSALDELIDQHSLFINQSSSHSKTYAAQEGDYDFHYQIIQASANKKLISLLCDELYHLIRMYRHQSRTARTDPATALQEHRFILEAIRNSDPELAEMLMRRHISGSRKLIETQLRAVEI